MAYEELDPRLPCEGRLRIVSRRQLEDHLQTETIDEEFEPDEVLLPDSWMHGHDVADITPEPGKPARTLKHVGQIVSSRIWMADGSVYRVNDGRPKQLRVGQGVVKTTPFGIRDDAGFSLSHQEQDVEQGFRTLVISRELEHKQPLSQARTAHNMLVIARHFFSDGDVDPVNIEARGISRSGMLAIVMKGLTDANPDYGLNVHYFSAIAPCFPVALALKPDVLAALPLAVATEALSSAYHVGRLPLKLALRYPNSFDLDPVFALESAKALVNGDAGRAVNYIDPESSHGFVLGYPDDFMGMGKVWQQLFKEHQGVDVHLERTRFFHFLDGHLRALSADDWKQDVSRQERLAEESARTNGSISDIDYRYVSLAR